MLDSNKQLRFPDGSKTEVILKGMGMEENDFGSEYIVRIKETIDGYDYFKPSEGLKKKIIEGNYSEGDKIVIEKVTADDKYQYGYFKVEMADNPVKTVWPPVQESPAKDSFVQNDNKLAVHELALRVETLEKEVLELKKSALPF